MGPCVAACALLSLAASAASPCQTSSTSGCRGGCVVEPVAAAAVVAAADVVAAVVVVAVVDLTDCGCDCSETASEGPLGAGALEEALEGALEGVLAEVLAGGKQEGRRLSWARCWIGLELLVALLALLAPLGLHDTPLRAELQAPERIFVTTEMRRI